MHKLSVVKILILSLCMSFMFAVKSYAVPPVFNKTFTFYAEKQQLSFVLTQFARSQSYKVYISPLVVGELSGRFTNMDPLEFLKGMNAAFGVNWYRLDNTIYFYNESESVRAFISPKAMSAERMFNMLKDANVFSPDLMPKFGKNDSMITISGPPEYLTQISQAAISFEEAQTTNIVMEVFPLKHAWADDISLSSMNQTVTVPGVASILRSMVLGVTSSPSNVVQHQASIAGLRGQGLASVGQQQQQTQDQNQQQQQQQQPAHIVNIMADSRVNAVIINDAAYRMPFYKKVIEDLDKPVELVEIHAAIVDINSNFSRDLGVDFQGNFEGGDVSGSGESSYTQGTFPAGNATAGTLAGAGLSLSTIYTFGADFFLARISALETNGDARVLGRPSVLTIDNVQASLENISTYYIPIQGADGESSDLFEVAAGTVLKVTPHIIKEENGLNSIKLVVNVEDNQGDSGTTTTQGTLAIPPIKQTKINTQAIVTEGQSLLLGGYYYEQNTDGESGVPGVKNIPIFGNLFKKKTKNTQQMERLILITPRIIRYNQSPNLPTHIDDKSFSRSPTQAHYEPRIPEKKQQGSGCARKRTDADNYKNPQGN